MCPRGLRSAQREAISLRSLSEGPALHSPHLGPNLPHPAAQWASASQRVKLAPISKESFAPLTRSLCVSTWSKLRWLREELTTNMPCSQKQWTV